MKKLLAPLLAFACTFSIISAVNAFADETPAPAPSLHVAEARNFAETPAFELAPHAYRDSLVAQVDTGSAAAPAGDVATDTGSAHTGSGSASVPPIGDPLAELAALKLKYDALKAARGSGDKDLLWFAYAALAAAFIRTLLSGIKAWRGDAKSGWAKWTALAFAVPLALLTYYAAGAGLWAAIVMAGAGPGAVVVNELFKKKTAAA